MKTTIYCIVSLLLTHTTDLLPSQAEASDYPAGTALRQTAATPASDAAMTTAVDRFVPAPRDLPPAVKPAIWHRLRTSVVSLLRHRMQTSVTPMSDSAAVRTPIPRGSVELSEQARVSPAAFSKAGRTASAGESRQPLNPAATSKMRRSTGFRPATRSGTVHYLSIDKGTVIR